MRRRILLLAVVVVTGAALWILLDLFSPYRAYSGNELLVVEPGEQASQIADSLVTRGVLRHDLPFLIRYWAGRPRHALRAGEYLFDRPLRPIDVYRKLVFGDVYLHVVMIPEGSDRFDIARILNLRLGIDPLQVLRITQLSAPIRDLDPAAPSLEGYLFPDTYRFARGVSAATVVFTMLTRFRHILATRLAKDLPPSPAGWHEVITVASLVEKETPDSSERPLIAGVFERRLQTGMPLQCDPTVIYAARLDHRPAGPITESELELDSPYNTYRHAGLPPGPISNPGEASIRAVLRPAGGEALYFVANNHGGHVFARSLAEHQRNVSRYRREAALLRRQTESESGDPKSPAPTSSKRAAQTHNRGSNTQQETDHP